MPSHPPRKPSGRFARGAARQRFATPRSLLKLLDAHAPGTREHQQRTAALCRSVGESLGLSEGVLDLLTRTAELHDIGKLALPSELLAKPGALSDWEIELIRQHTVLGQRLLEGVENARALALIVRATHERYDGTGYPDRLTGKAIPLPARIIAVCDAFDVLTQPRPYGPTLSPAEAVEELRRGAGSQFDPAVTDAFCTVVALRA